MRDDTLDMLLAALWQGPRHKTLAAPLVGIVGDRLEETGHPAAAWWRAECRGLGRDARRRGDERLVPILGPVGWRIDERDEHRYAGITDLCARLDRLASPTAC